MTWMLFLACCGVVLGVCAAAWILTEVLAAFGRWLVGRIKPGPAEYSHLDHMDGLGRRAR